MVNRKRRPIRKKKNRGGERLAQWRLMKRLYPNIEICNVSNEDIASGITTSNSVKEMIEDSADQWDDSKSLIQTDGTDELGNSNEFFISGRRLVDLNYFIAQIKCISNHAPQLGCSIVNMKLQNEIKRDFNYGLVFACDMCGMVKTIWTEPEEIAMMDMSGTTRVGAISSCSDFLRTEKQMGSKNVQYSSFKTYQKHSRAVSKGWEKSALQEMKKSAEEECRMVRKRGNTLDAADGSWAKRSSHTNCNPLDRIGNASSPGVSKATWSLGGSPNLQVDLPYEEYEMKQEEEEEIIDFQTPEAFSPLGSLESVFHVQGVPSPSAGIEVPVCSNQTDSTRPPCLPPPHLDVQNKTKQDGSFRTAAIPDPLCTVFVKEEPEQEESSSSAFYEEDQSFQNESGSAFSVQQPKEIFENKGTNQVDVGSQLYKHPVSSTSNVSGFAGIWKPAGLLPAADSASSTHPGTTDRSGNPSLLVGQSDTVNIDSKGRVGNNQKEDKATACSEQPRDSKRFRKPLITELVSGVRNQSFSQRGRPSSVDQEDRLNKKTHFIYANERSNSKECAVCSNRKAGQRRETVYFCATCVRKPSLHIGQCFERYHTLKNYKM